MENFNLMHAKALYLRFCAIYDHKFVKNYHDDDFKSLWVNEWHSGLCGIEPIVIKDVLEYCKKNLEWPPSIAEFVKICESYSGIPTLEQSISSATRREFSHPIVLFAYKKVGGWAMKNDSSKEIKIKFQAAYLEALNEFRENKDASWEMLESFNAKPKELPPPPKIPSQQERKSFKERIAEYQKRLEEAKINCEGKTYREFDEKAINPNNVMFDKKIYEEYRAYLLSIPEKDAIILPPRYAYARMRFISQKGQPEFLRKVGYNPNPQVKEEVVSKLKYGAYRPYKHWTGD